MGNARASWTELGALTGLSAPAAADRVRRMEEKGVIRAYSAAVDPEAVGLGMAAFIAVSLSGANSRAPFLTNVRNLPEVLECHHVAGDADYILKVRCRDTHALEDLISRVLKAMPGVDRTRTTVILSTVKETSRLPLPCGEG